MKLFFLWDLDKSKLKLMRGRQMGSLLRTNPVPRETRKKPLVRSSETRRYGRGQ